MSQVAVEAETGEVYENPVIWTESPNSGSIYENAAGIGRSDAQKAAANENNRHKHKTNHQQQAYEDLDTRERLEADTQALCSNNDH